MRDVHFCEGCRGEEFIKPFQIELNNIINHNSTYNQAVMKHYSKIFLQKDTLFADIQPINN